MNFFDFRICSKKFKNTVQKNYSYLKEQYAKDGKNLPNRITEGRLLFSFVLGLLLYFSSNSRVIEWIVFVLFVLIAATDKLDGYLARKLNKVTEFGKLFDPIVDKVLMGMVLIPVLFIYGDLWPFIVVILVCELVVSGISLWKKFQVSWLGKLRMVVQCVALSFLFLPIGNLYALKRDFIITTMVVNMVSMISCILRAIKIGRNSDS